MRLFAFGIMIFGAVALATSASAQNWGCFGPSGDCKTIKRNGRYEVVCCDGDRRGPGRYREWDGGSRGSKWGCFGRSGDCKTVRRNGRKVVICCD